ncbi:DNA topoisomerase [Emericellopsis atlantica]|uniref:DNA topoisomerase 2 n=1 Tax=Emericellopsis atlantica TaxID=2614577 RepID=A0A9P8CUL1_9HYPO|nr:DNA topoisomerase [Emericellopsis atlantica]KAG9259242.1 DNA topoisomerase [Emericellopsis atlantica]
MDSDESAFISEAESDGFVPEPVIKKTKAAAVKKAPAPKAKKMTQSTLKVSKKRPAPENDDQDDDSADGSGFSNTPPKKQKKAPAVKKSAGAPLAELENDSMAVEETSKGPTKKKTASETYQKLTQREHIMHRPDTYVGSIEKTTQTMWVYNKETQLMEYKEVTFVPGFYKIFDEILVNAADNKQRDSSMSHMKITIDREQGVISVENNGKGIPIVMHEKEKMYIPEMIFGVLLTGANYDDNEKKTVGGRNGYGAKLCNIFSKEFTLECQDNENGKRYKQTWTDNMLHVTKAKITSSKTSDFVRVTFKPDFEKLNMPEGIDDTLESLLLRRVYDMAGTVRGVRTYLNGEHIKIKDFKSYCNMYAKAIAHTRAQEEGVTPVTTVEIDDDKGHPRWEIGFTVSDGTFQQVSFVNSIATTSGGTHVNYIADQMTNALLKQLNKKAKGHTLKQNHLRNHIFVFVNCLINNPTFNSQTKEQTTTKVSQFGSKCELSEKFLKKIAASEALQNIMAFAEKKADKLMAKSDGSKRSRVSNAKLVEANLAGTRRGHECTLILTEGDSAKGLAVAGRAILDPDRIGVFPLRGKMLNVRDATADQISKNTEIQNIKQFLGLKHKAVYTDNRSLRYGHLMIMADQDHDGSHIKGLLINFLQVMYPSLLQVPGFFQGFITPIVKVWQGSNPKKPLRLKSFFTQPQYEEWKEAHRNELTKWRSKYLKGLGSSTPEDAQIYFKDLDKHLKQFQTVQPGEPELYELVFSKKKADARKAWLGEFVPGTYLDMSTSVIKHTDFVNRELILFSMADNVRSVPSVLDGFKPGQRKVIYACFKRNLVKDTKVVELAGYVSEQTSYHHGEASLHQTIIGLAQNFVGSNNINCLEPSGTFGSRLAGGSDAASPRYIFTRLSPFARKIFSPLDEPNLNYQTEEGVTIEPDTYSPILPMVLVNGADGIGTGWSTNIPNYHPMDIVNNLKRRMGRLDPDNTEEAPFESMMPWFRGWKGVPEPAGPDRFKFNGVAYRDDRNPNEIIITELPIRVWTDNFKAQLEKIISGDDGPSWIKDYKEFNDHQTVHFEIQVDEKHIDKVMEAGLLEKFKLQKQVATSNMVAFDAEGRIRRYEKVEDILDAFYVHRLQMYTERKKHWLDVYHREFRKVTNQARFIQEIIDGKLVVGKKRKDVLVQELRDRDYEAFPNGVNQKKKDAEDEMNESGDDENDDSSEKGSARDYDYLLSMPIWSLTAERLAKLKEAMGNKQAQHDELLALSEKDLWCRDLDEFAVEWEKQETLDAQIAKDIRRTGRRVSKKIGAGRGKKAKDEDDYEPEAKAKSKAKTSKAAAAVAPSNTKSAQRFAEMFGSGKTAVKKEPKAEPSTALDGFSDDDFAALSRAKPSSAPAAKPVVKKETPALSLSEYEEEEPVPQPTRNKRVAASRAKTFIDLDSDSDEDDDMMLGDVGAMVKGIGKSEPESSGSGAGTGRLSLHAMTRPESSGGPSGSKPKPKPKSSKAFDEDSPDDTNYEMLAKSSPFKPASKAKDIDEFLSDDDDEKPVVVSKAAPKPKPSASKADALPVVKKARGRPAGVKNKAANEPATKPKPAPKQTTLSPAAKAYALKKSAAKKSVPVDDEEDEDEDMADPESPAPRPAARGRPGRAAAARKPVIIDEDSTMGLDEDDESDDGFDMDDDED